MTRAIIDRYHAEMYGAPNNVEKISRVNPYPGSKVATPLRVPKIQFRVHVWWKMCDSIFLTRLINKKAKK